MTDLYLYPGTSVLRNKRDITDKQELAEAEAYFVEARLAAIRDAPIERSFTPEHLCGIHRWLFGDIYSWAGEYRRTDFSKGRTQFWDFRGIEPRLIKLFRRLHEGPLLREIVDDNAFLRELAILYLDLNHLHPFREGNGRTQRTFLEHVAQTSGRSLDWTRVAKDENDQACASATINQNPAPLRALLEPIILAPEDDDLPPSARLIYSFREAKAAVKVSRKRADDTERDQHLVLQAIQASLELTRLSEETREAAELRHGYVKALKDAGRSMDWIAERLGISKSAVQKILDRS